MKYRICNLSVHYGNNIFAIILALSTFNIVSAQQKHFLINNNGNPLRNFVTSLHSESHPFFVDIDGDGDLDCFSGEFGNNKPSKIYYYRNDGSDKSPRFIQITGADNPLDKATSNRFSIPYFIDIDGSGTYDCFIGDGITGGLIYYKNVGTATQPKFEKQSAAFNPLSMVKFWASGVASPAFADIDGDGDFDCLIVDEQGKENYFKNIGTATGPEFMHQTDADPFKTLASKNDIYNVSFEDWNKDGLVDLFINTNYYKNIGTKTNPKFALVEDFAPVFQNKSTDRYSFTPLQWVDLNHDSIPEVFHGTPSGTFVYQTISSNDQIGSNSENLITVFPNPSKKEFILKNIPTNAPSSTIISITDLQGNLLITQTIGSKIIKFGESLKTGVYVVQVIQNNTVIYKQKIIKEQ
jgi:hypothetical protein